jgi:hypothetical protein
LKAVSGSLKITAKTLYGLAAGKSGEGGNRKAEDEEFECFHYLYY